MSEESSSGTSFGGGDAAGSSFDSAVAFGGYSGNTSEGFCCAASSEPNNDNIYDMFCDFAADKRNNSPDYSISMFDEYDDAKVEAYESTLDKVDDTIGLVNNFWSNITEAISKAYNHFIAPEVAVLKAAFSDSTEGKADKKIL